MKYRIVFKGDLKPGVSKAQTVAVLSKFSGFDEEKTEKVFFSGKPVQLKVVEGEDKAKAFLKKLAALGIVAKGLQAKSPEPAQQTASAHTSAEQASSEEAASGQSTAAETPKPSQNPERAKSVKVKRAEAQGDTHTKATAPEQSDPEVSQQQNANPESTPSQGEQAASPEQAQESSAEVVQQDGADEQELPEQEQAEREEQLSSSEADEKNTQTRPFKANKWLLPALASLAGLVVVVVGAYIFFVSSLISTAVPVEVNKAENALLEMNVALLGHINARKIFELEELLAEDEELDLLEGMAFVEQLQAQGINVRTDLSQIVLGLHFDEELGSYLTQVFITGAPKGFITKFLEQHYVLETTAQEGLEVLTFSQQDKQSCRISDPRSLIAGNGFVVISHPKKVAEIYRAINAAHKEKVVNQKWLEYRDSHLVSIGVLNPQQLESGLPGMFGFLLMEAQSHWASMRSVFLGVRGVALPPAVKLDFAIESDKAEWLKQSHGSLTAIVNKHKEDYANNEVNFFSLLMSRVELTQSRSQLRTEFTIDKQLVSSAAELMNDGLSGAMVSALPSSDNSPAPLEIIDENPLVFLEQVSLEEVPPFLNEYKRQYAWADKYFAAFVKSVAVNRDGLNTIEIEVNGAKLPNQADSLFGKQAQLVVTDIQTADGSSILQQEVCGMNLNHEPAKFNMNAANKLVRLKEGASIQQAASISARINATIPTKTQALMLPVPLTQAEFENAGSTLSISGVSGGNVSYSLSGEPGGFLAIRALNKDKKYLRSGSSFSFSGAISHEFSGEIAFIEIIKALETEQLTSELMISNPMVIFPADGFTFLPKEPEAYSTEQWDKLLAFSVDFKPDQEKRSWYGDPVASSRSGPVDLKLYAPQVLRNIDGPVVSAKFELNMPYARILDEKSNLVSVRVKEILFDDGNRYTEQSEHPVAMSFIGFGNKARVAELPEERLRKNIYLSGTADIEIPLEGEEYLDKRILLIVGELVFNIPTAIKTMDFSEIELGKNYQLNDVLRIEVIELSSTGISLATHGDPSALAALQVLNEKNRMLGSGVNFTKEQKRYGVKPNYAGEAEPPVRYVASYHYNGRAVALRVALAESKETFIYPYGLPVRNEN
ncbi:hypothetical protein SAMN02745866_01010 [Alteromonadaceae bacterium Bs31]|nr:hypothetical protein SAMN02745866_01010 [Alteromonadaceae bacterium Bs31]